MFDSHNMIWRDTKNMKTDSIKIWIKWCRDLNSEILNSHPIDYICNIFSLTLRQFFTTNCNKLHTLKSSIPISPFLFLLRAGIKSGWETKCVTGKRECGEYFKRATLEVFFQVKPPDRKMNNGICCISSSGPTFWKETVDIWWDKKVFLLEDRYWNLYSDYEKTYWCIWVVIQIILAVIEMFESSEWEYKWRVF